MRLATPPLWLCIANWFRSEPGAGAAARKAGLSFARRLLEVNANRVGGGFDERNTESRRGVEGGPRGTLRETVVAAEKAAVRTREVQRQRSAAVERAVVLIDRRLEQLARLSRAWEIEAGAD
jgi:hypothetical protein